MVNLKYKYALDADGNVVNISNAIKGVSYFCMECGQEMVYCKGEKVRSYFRHKNSGDIERFPHDNETYLHKLAKKLYAQKMIKKEPVICDMEIVECCSQYEVCPVHVENCCERFVTKEFNLMNFYDYVGTEVKFGKYTPDILLKNKKTGKSLFFEVWVNHKCTDDKLQNNSVVEVKIESEEDILNARPVFLINDENYETRIHYFKENIGSFNGLICNTFNELYSDKNNYNYSKDLNAFISMVRNNFSDIDSAGCALYEKYCNMHNIENTYKGGHIYPSDVCAYCNNDGKYEYECGWECPIYRLKYSIFYPQLGIKYYDDNIFLWEKKNK